MSQMQSQITSSQDLQNRFENLLRPIRDLEQNWSIDLVEELEEALKDLELTPVNFGNGETMIDFGKAALLLQGGAHIYSKKVDYLYRTFLEIKEWLFNMWNAKKKSQSTKPGDITSATEQTNFLDDGENEDDYLPEREGENDNNLLSEECDVYADDVPTLLPAFACLMGSATTCAKKVPLLNQSDVVIGHMNEFITCSLSTQSEKTGWLYTDYADYELRTALHNCREHGSETANVPETMMDRYPLAVEPIVSDTSLPGNYLDVNGDDDDDCAPMKADQMSSWLAAENTPIAWQHAMQQRKRRRTALVVQVEEVDPWTETLDPHEILPRLSKPMKIGNCRQLPLSLRKGTKRNQKGSSTSKPLADIATFCNKEFAAKSCIPTTSSLLYSEFMQLFSVRLKERLDKIRNLQRSKRWVLDYSDDEHEQQFDDIMEDCNEDNNDDVDLPFSRFQVDQLSAPEIVNEEDENVLQKYIKHHYEHMVQQEELSEIDKRVRLWEQSVKGAIQATEQQAPFDVLSYSSDIIDSFTDDQISILFEKIVEGKPRYEAYRLFVSTLTLANHGNIDILADSLSNMEISLLNRKMLSEAMMEDMPQSRISQSS